MKRRYMFAGFFLIAAIGVGYLALGLSADGWGIGVAIHDTPISVDSAMLMPPDDANPSPYYKVTYLHGGTDTLSPQDYALLLLKKDDSRSFTFRLLNISTPVGIAWVTLGLLGQVLFTGRMVVQWLVSEKEKQSVVPPSFWWMSLIGASMLITYFIWRKDIVGFLGQGTGWLIYLRNIWMIYRTKPAKQPAEAD
ncbi:MAG: lipid-A-disaccharide synthase N-terminal domain-containing protein [Phycisphaerales bacterium]